MKLKELCNQGIRYNVMVVDPYDGAMTVVNNQYCHLYMMYKDGDINEDDKHKIINEVFQICADSIM